MIRVAYGGGVNSTALLVECINRKVKVDVITFADTGGEKPETYWYVNRFNEYLKSKEYPEIITVKKNGMDGGSLETECLRKHMLPSLAYGKKGCSLKYKKQPQDYYLNHLEQAQIAWANGEKITVYLGYDANEKRRVKVIDDKKYWYEYPLIEWNLGRKECLAIIDDANLPIPLKSSCFFCPASKATEIRWLKDKHPDLVKRAIDMESNARLTSLKGLGISYSWDSLLANQEIGFIYDNPLPCECYD